MADARWSLIEPVFTAWREKTDGASMAARVHDLWVSVNAIVYVDHTGFPREYLPHDF
ncbi:transposase [Streptomyces sp. CA2R101]|uniref:transposase n=1 Tax=Streptomyces sp. CA2R101 TaxID=3120152 RepID=UPI00300B5F98